MDVYIYTEGIRKVKGEEQVFLTPLAELEDFETVDAALEALVDAEPDLLGTEFVIFTEQPEYITVDPPPETKYSFSRRSNGNQAAIEEEPEVEPEEDEEPEEAPAPAARRRPAAKKAAAKKTAGRRRPAAKKGGARAGTRTGSSKRTPFTKNAASAD